MTSLHDKAREALADPEAPFNYERTERRSKVAQRIALPAIDVLEALDVVQRVGMLSPFYPQANARLGEAIAAFNAALAKALEE